MYLLSPHFFSILSSDEIQEYFMRWGYLGIFFWFVTIDQIAPLPEEISLIVIGYFCSNGTLNPVLAGVFSLLAFVTVDLVYYSLTISGNKLIKKLTVRAKKNVFGKYKDRLKKNMPGTLIVMCFIPRMRQLGPVFVALGKLPVKKFILYDTLGLSVFTALYISIGIIFHHNLEELISKVGIWQQIIFAAALIVAGGLVLFFLQKKKY
jgi:membrane protein DedA with SNARE-associated domain